MQDIIDKEIIKQKRQQELNKYNDISSSQLLRANKSHVLSYSNLYQAAPVTISSLYEDYSTGQISVLEALEKRDEILQWTRMINSSQNLTNQSSLIRKNLDETLIEMEGQNNRRHRHTNEVMDNISKYPLSKYNKLKMNEKIYSDFKTALKENANSALQLKPKNTNDEIYDLYDLNPSQETPREQNKGLFLPKAAALQIKTESAKAGHFFFDQPIKDYQTFFFSHCFLNKEQILKYLNEELAMREYHQSGTTYNSIKGIALKRLEKEIVVLREIIKGLLLNKIILEPYNTRYYKYKLNLKIVEAKKSIVNEFIVQLDLVNELPPTAEKVRIKYGYFRKGFKQEANRTSNEHFVESEGEKCYIKELDKVIFPDKKLDHFIYFQILIFHYKVNHKF